MNSIFCKTVRCAFLLIGLGTLSFGQANEVLIEWGTASKQLVAYPPSIDYVTHVTVRVMNVNDLLYEYSGRIAAKPRATSNPTIDGILAGTANLGLAPSSCPPDLTTQLNSFKQKYEALLPDKKKPQSILLNDTVKGWQTNVAPLVQQITSTLDSSPQCKQGPLKVEIASFLSIVDTWSQKLTANHDFTFSTQLAPDNDYTVYIDEKYEGTSTGEKSFSFSPQSTLISLSGGFLYTELEGRSYERRDVPGTSGNQTVLAANGSGPVRPVFASTINVKIPFVDSICKRGKCWNTDKFGLDLSIGPALQLGTGSSNVSRLGLFAGLSIVLGQKFLITPGVHVGDFADFPLGFSHQGQPIPPTFTQQLTPVTRTTARFGVAVTFKGFSLVKSTSGPKTSGTTTNPPATTGGSTTNTKAPKAPKTPKAPKAPAGQAQNP